VKIKEDLQLIILVSPLFSRRLKGGWKRGRGKEEKDLERELRLRPITIPDLLLGQGSVDEGGGEKEEGGTSTFRKPLPFMKSRQIPVERISQMEGGKERGGGKEEGKNEVHGFK